MTKSSLKQKILFASLFALTLSSCQYEGDFINEIEENPVIEQLQGIQRDIVMNIALNRTGNVTQTSPKSRSIDVRLTPHILDGDTVLYIAQYADGWEIYSGSKLTNMVLFSSEHGIFDFTDELPESLRFIIEANAQEIKYLPRETGPEQVHSSWGAASITEADLRDGHITAKVKSRSAQRRVISYSDLPPGHWEWYSTEKIDETTDISPKLTTTYWHQQSPWNKYSKYVQNPITKQYVLAPNGCVAVSIAQYMFYTHFIENWPKISVTTATLTEDGKDFTYSEPSLMSWYEMPLSSNDVGNFDYVAAFIGDIGHKLGADYQYNGTIIKRDKIDPYLEAIYLDEFSSEELNIGKIKTSIDDNLPIITDANSDITSEGKESSMTGHSFLIDQYKVETSTYKLTYVYKRDPLPSGTEDIWDWDDMDEEGNVISWAYTNEIINTIPSYNISMNWGANQNGEYYNSIFYSPYESWSIGGLKYNLNHTIHVRTKRN
ncbi:MAG: C10 family peptidase [Duncaniella sp.]|nr:C10 family peptidase [Muribaculum sp.]MCM1256049.1 C10 family peptidase [Duncaniella sp.]